MVVACLWTPFHLSVFRNSVAAGVAPPYFEKSMALTWSESLEIAEQSGCQLTLCDQCWICTRCPTCSIATLIPLTKRSLSMVKALRNGRSARLMPANRSTGSKTESAPISRSAARTRIYRLMLRLVTTKPQLN